MVDIVVALSGLKTAADLTRMLRDGLKSGQVKTNEAAARIGDIYDAIVDSKDALNDAKDEIVRLQDEVKKLNKAADEEHSFTFEHGVYWKTSEVQTSRREGPEQTPVREIRYHGPFCPLCKDVNQQAVHLKHDGIMQDGTQHIWFCEVHKSDYIAPTMQP
jgi:hypothetical protein